MRYGLLMLSGILFLGGVSFAPTTALAQTCNPACTANEICIAVGDTGTDCVPKATCTGPNCQVDEVVVTASKSTGTSFKDFVNGPVTEFGNLIVQLLFALAFLFFLYGVFKFFFAQGEKGRDEGKKYVVYGLIGLAVLFSVWGLVRLFISTLGTWAGV